MAHNEKQNKTKLVSDFFFFFLNTRAVQKDDCGVCGTSPRFAVQKCRSVSDAEALVYYRTHCNAVIINIAKVVLC